MERYHFHVIDQTECRDLHGTLLKDVFAAKREALRFAGDLLKDLGDKLWSGAAWNIRVTDSDDLTLFELHFSGIDLPNLREP